MRFVWFWTFWHWSKESFRAGHLLRSPLQGVGGHWDEWFQHEASEQDLRAIEQTGRSESTQREFIAWLFRHWADDCQGSPSRMAPRFVAAQLAQVPPFKKWRAFEKYRDSYGLAGVSALVLSGESAGGAEDVRRVEAVVLPADSAGQKLIPEGFQAEAAEFAAARSAAQGVLRGKGLLILLGLWVFGGRRPYPRWFSTALSAGWVAVAGLILFLLMGPEPGNQLFLLSAVLLVLWCTLMLVAAAAVVTQSFRAWRTGAELRAFLEQSQMRLRMNGGLTLKGGSAGLPFCLNLLLALHHSRPEAARRSWIWNRFFSEMHSEAESWAATGVITAAGYVSPVVIEPKLRACLQHNRIQHILTPRQREATQRALCAIKPSTGAIKKESSPELVSSPMQIGFAAEKPCLRIHRCRHLAQAIMALGRLNDRRRIIANVFPLIVSAIMVGGLPDLRSILLPYPAPVAVEPASASPYFLWASLDTKHPRYFSAVLESRYWSNRRAEVQPRGGLTPSVRAEIRLHRVIGTEASEEEGFVWIERRRRFLTREFLPGERVGRYSIPYLTRIGHE